MGIFASSTPDELEDKLDKLKIESSIENTKLDIEKFKAMQTELQKKYGKGWRRKLGMKSGKKNLNNQVSMENMANMRFRPIEPPPKLVSKTSNPLRVSKEDVVGIQQGQ